MQAFASALSLRSIPRPIGICGLALGTLFLRMKHDVLPLERATKARAAQRAGLLQGVAEEQQQYERVSTHCWLLWLAG